MDRPGRPSHQGAAEAEVRTSLVTDDGPLVNSCRPSVDVLFHSVAQCFNSSTLAVVLTGMGQDGLEGCRSIAAAGGRIVVQDQRHERGLGHARSRRQRGTRRRRSPVQRYRTRRSSDGSDSAHEARRPRESTSRSRSTRSDFDYVRGLVRDSTAIALDNTKVYLVNARLLPVARDAGFPSVVALIKHLRSRPFGELHTNAVEAIVTTETSFFRDFFPFEALRQEVIPEIMAEPKGREPKPDHLVGRLLERPGTLQHGHDAS